MSNGMRFSYSEAVKRGWVKKEDVPESAKEGAPKRGEIEGDEQSVLIEEVRAQFPLHGHLLIHIPNGGSRKNAFEGYRLKKQGVRAGVSDLLLPVARGGYFGLWIEYKAAPPNSAPITKSQQEWIDLMIAEGYQAVACLGIDAAMRVISDYLSLAPTHATMHQHTSKM